MQGGATVVVLLVQIHPLEGEPPEGRDVPLQGREHDADQVHLNINHQLFTVVLSMIHIIFQFHGIKTISAPKMILDSNFCNMLFTCNNYPITQRQN